MVPWKSFTSRTPQRTGELASLFDPVVGRLLPGFYNEVQALGAGISRTDGGNLEGRKKNSSRFCACRSATK